MGLYQTARRVALDLLPPLFSRVISRHLIEPITRRIAAPHYAPQYRILRTLEEVDKALVTADELGQGPHEKLRDFFQTFEYRPNLSDVPADPYSTEYFDYQMQLYYRISGRSTYKAEVNESTPADVAAMSLKPYPYATESAKLIGDYLIMEGNLFAHMPIKPRSRILEFGPGTGGTTMHMVQMGHDVTAVDISQKLTEVIQERARMLKQPVRTAVSDMLNFKSDEPFDAVVFFECFHHCLDHMQLLRNLQSLVKDDGFIIFGGEPITDCLPYPWGIRTDGISVWSIRRHGWLELGFQPGYFADVLAKTGWRAETFHSRDVSHMSVVVARKST